MAAIVVLHDKFFERAGGGEASSYATAHPDPSPSHAVTFSGSTTAVDARHPSEAAA